METKIKPIAFYLPQFHPIPENDTWWGKGFTEWTNVAKARPLFEGHYQPRLPADLGFYDLRVSETRLAQVDLAKQYGIYGFSYWHYWFGGKQILERPLQEVIKSGQPDFPFCLAWANQTWKGTWHGLSNDQLLIEQTYPGKADYEAHFYTILPALKDSRYIEVAGKKMFLIFQPEDIPDVKEFISFWKELAVKEGLEGIHFVAMHMRSDWDFASYGFDAIIQGLAPWVTCLEKTVVARDLISRVRRKLNPPQLAIDNSPRKVSYKSFVEEYSLKQTNKKEYPLIFGDWDNTPRSGNDGWVFNDFTINLFEAMCLHALRETENKSNQEKFIFIKSWNEWAEGNYLEPDMRYGKAYLKAFKNALHTS